jgi:hypothetical protein
MRNSYRLLLSIGLALAACTGHAVVTTGPGPARPMPPPEGGGDGPGPIPQGWNPAGWVLLGSQWVNGNVDRDVIHVGKRDGVFDKLTIVVNNSDLEMLDMTVVFTNGERWSPHLKHTFHEGQRTGAIDLPGSNRFIQEIEILYKNIPGGGRAHVDIYGKNERERPPVVGGAPPPPPPPPAPPPPADDYDNWDKTGWVMLGSQTVAGKRDRDVFPVGKKFGRFDVLKVVVKDSELEMNDVVVTFENGDKFEPKLKHFFKEGARSKAINLPGSDRIVKDISVLYGNTWGGGRARVELWAKNVPDRKEKQLEEREKAQEKRDAEKDKKKGK